MAETVTSTPIPQKIIAGPVVVDYGKVAPTIPAPLGHAALGNSYYYGKPQNSSELFGNRRIGVGGGNAPTSPSNSTVLLNLTFPTTQQTPPPNTLLQTVSNVNPFNYYIPEPLRLVAGKNLVMDNEPKLNPLLNLNIRNIPGQTKKISPDYPTQYGEIQRPESVLTINRRDIEPVEPYRLPILESVQNNLNNNLNNALNNQDFSQIVKATGQQIFIGLPVGFTKALLYDIPVATVKTPYKFLSAPGEVIQNILEIPSQLRQGLITAPGQTIGSTVALGIAPSIYKDTFYTISDDIRTFDREKLDTEKIIAPEYFQGQRYPQISKGETAGQLLQEFKDQDFGYTASPRPLKVSEGVLPGSSELPGLYQAPRVSPLFLRITEGERPIFSLNPFKTLRPTISKVTPLSFELVPGLDFNTDVGIGEKLNSIRDFFYNSAEKGKSYVPFIKTEKESIIPFDTQLEKTGENYYIDFEGRKVPINEYRTLSGQPTNKNIYTAREVSRSSRLLSEEPVYSPLDISRIPNYASPSLYSPSSSVLSVTSPSYRPGYSGSSNILISSEPNISNKSIPSYTETPPTTKSSSSTENYGEPSYINSINGPKIVNPSEPYPSPTEEIYGPPLIRLSEGGKKKRQIRTVPTYSVNIKRYGLYRPVASGVTYNQAVKLGESRSLQSLGRTIRLKQTGNREVVNDMGNQEDIKVNDNIFRDYKISKGRQVFTPDQFIKRTKFNLSTSGAKSEIKLARQIKMQSFKIPKIKSPKNLNKSYTFD